jgi:hypothetical protein
MSLALAPSLHQLDASGLTMVLENRSSDATTITTSAIFLEDGTDNDFNGTSHLSTNRKATHQGNTKASESASVGVSEGRSDAKEGRGGILESSSMTSVQSVLDQINLWQNF